MLTNQQTNERKGVEGIAVVSGGSKAALAADQSALLPVYLASVRERFKNEVNRLTAGSMRDLLSDIPDADVLSFPLSYLYIWHWLRHNVHEHYRAEVLETFRGPRFGFLMDLLLSENPQAFVRGYIRHWQTPAPDQKQWQEIQYLLSLRGGDVEKLVTDMLSTWAGLDLFTETYMVQFKQVARDERNRYEGMLDAADLERLALVDQVADVESPSGEPRYAKMGIIPAMGCPQTCRHCMFTWRPPRAKDEDPDKVFANVNRYTDSVLFTGGDLTRQLDFFYAAIRKMPSIRNFAILLNGDFADDPTLTEQVLGSMAAAIKSRPHSWAPAKVLLQISFDEFHQEVYVDKQGLLAERIPVAKIANIVECYPRHAAEIQLALLHKQTGLNFSQDVLHKGVFARLARELGHRGHQVRVTDMQASPRRKHNPKAPEQLQTVFKDATFVLQKHADCPILLTSSTIDGYGRAALLEEWETVKEHDLLHEVLTHGPPAGESFDIDMMLWFNGWVTLFNAVHICLGNHYSDGMQKIIARHRKDPLSKALHRFDRRLLEYYSEIRDDLEQKLKAATGPHHLFHALTEDSAVRLHMTRRLFDSVQSGSL